MSTHVHNMYKTCTTHVQNMYKTFTPHLSVWQGERGLIFAQLDENIQKVSITIHSFIAIHGKMLVYLHKIQFILINSEIYY